MVERADEYDGHLKALDLLTAPDTPLTEDQIKLWEQHPPFNVSDNWVQWNASCPKTLVSLMGWLGHLRTRALKQIDILRNDHENARTQLLQAVAAQKRELDRIVQTTLPLPPYK